MYKGIYYGDIYKDISLTGIYIIVTNSLTTLIKIVVKIIITSIDISRLIFFEVFFSKINIKEIVDNSRIAFYNISI